MIETNILSFVIFYHAKLVKINEIEQNKEKKNDLRGVL